MVKFHGVQEFKVKEDHAEVKLLTGFGTVVSMKIDLTEQPDLENSVNSLAHAIMTVAVKILEA